MDPCDPLAHNHPVPAAFRSNFISPILDGDLPQACAALLATAAVLRVSGWMSYFGSFCRRKQGICHKHDDSLVRPFIAQGHLLASFLIFFVLLF